MVTKKARPYTVPSDFYDEPKPAVPMVNTARQCICILPTIFALFVFIYALVLICKSYKSADEFDPSRELLKYVEKNLEMNSIYEIKHADKDKACDPGFTQINLGMFPEVKSGCVCSDGSVHGDSYCYMKMKFTSNCELTNGI